MDALRIDKWLWAARFFKTRSFASKACELGRILANGQPAKPAREVRIGDLLKIRRETTEYEVEVLGVSHNRGPASVAQTLYRETETSREARARLAEAHRLSRFQVETEGRPSKKDRRQINRLRGR
jgi:ribosome-associated heat shock protein Hsp15